MPAVREKKVARALSPVRGGFLRSFTHTFQPYTGCAFGQATTNGLGCPYCYVRRLPVQLFASEPWGEWVEPKVNAAEVLEKELRALERRGKLQDTRIFMSSATDPYQGPESTFRITRACIEAFVRHPPGLLVVQTRSPLVLRDMDLLEQLQGRAWVSLTVETDDDQVRRLITPTSPTVSSRLRALEQLTERGISVQAAVSPMLPNHPQDFANLLQGRCHRVVVDTLLHGDGAHGKRSEALGMRKQLTELGYANWYSHSAHEPLLEALRQRFAPEAVLFSEEGFNTW